MFDLGQTQYDFNIEQESSTLLYAWIIGLGRRVTLKKCSDQWNIRRSIISSKWTVFFFLKINEADPCLWTGTICMKLFSLGPVVNKNCSKICNLSKNEETEEGNTLSIHCNFEAPEINLHKFIHARKNLKVS